MQLRFFYPHSGGNRSPNVLPPPGRLTEKMKVLPRGISQFYFTPVQSIMDIRLGAVPLGMVGRNENSLPVES